MIRSVASVDHAEVLAFRKGQILAQARHPDLVVIKGDAFVVVNSLLWLGKDCSTLGDLIEDCKLLMAPLPNVYIVHVFRKANHVAHRLARYALGSPDSRSWYGDVLDII